jgi:hypothetical protein
MRKTSETDLKSAPNEWQLALWEGWDPQIEAQFFRHFREEAADFGHSPGRPE